MVIYHATKYKISSKHIHIALNLTWNKMENFPYLNLRWGTTKSATLVTSLVTSLFSTATSTQDTKSPNKNLASAHHPPGSCDFLIEPFSSGTWPIFLSSWQLITKQHQSVSHPKNHGISSAWCFGDSQNPAVFSESNTCLFRRVLADS